MFRLATFSLLYLIYTALTAVSQADTQSTKGFTEKEIAYTAPLKGSNSDNP